MCKLVLIECGLILRRVGNGYVRRNECPNLSIIIIIIIIIIVVVVVVVVVVAAAAAAFMVVLCICYGSFMYLLW